MRRRRRSGGGDRRQDSHLIRPLTEANAWGVTVDGDDEVDVYPLQP
ncbi:MAG: hypothetical protein IT381_08225 [Deltaproteobacteria bacterium]|nr:hypothetical protein [Deltaproteobacteria bacterium]